MVNVMKELQAVRGKSGIFSGTDHFTFYTLPITLTITLTIIPTQTDHGSDTDYKTYNLSNKLS